MCIIADVEIESLCQAALTLTSIDGLVDGLCIVEELCNEVK